MKLRNKSPILKLTLSALCIAMYIGLSFVSIKIPPFLEITLKGFPLILIAIIYGPIEGFIVGLAGEFICQLIPAINVYGLTITTPLWLLPVAIRGLIVGLMFKQKDIRKHKFLWVLTVIISSLVVTALNTGMLYLDGVIMEYPVAFTTANILIRFLNCLITAAIYILVFPLIFEPLKRTSLFEKDSE